MRQDEETDFAEEPPACNMAASGLETVEYRSRSGRDGFNFTRMSITPGKPLPSVREQGLVHGDVRQHPVERLVVHGDTAHQDQHRFIARHLIYAL